MTETQDGVRIAQRKDYQFDNRFGKDAAPLLTDEPPPLGQGAGPSPTQLLVAAVGNCLSASLLFALRKYKQNAEPIGCEVQAQVGRNDANRLRVQGIRAILRLGVPAANIEHLQRALDTFEDFCTVTASLRQAIPVQVEVFDSLGVRLK
jgi:uncharacterized OsmC-like protein